MWREVFSTLVDRPPGELCDEYDGLRLPPGTDSVVMDMRTWEVREDDAWILTYPKAGTTWAQEIMCAALYDGNLEALRKRHALFRVLYLDRSLPEPLRRLKSLPETHRIAEEIPSPRVLKSHLPGHLLPPQLWEKKPKIVYVMRNPKDLAVSYFHYSKMVLPIPQKLAQSFGEFLDEMLSGKATYGPWWEHYLYFWRRRHQPNILLLRFEDMKKDLRGHVEKISRFLGKNLPAETLDAITEHCTFANMKANPMAHIDAIFEKRGPTKEYAFMRKGKVGDWKSHFTVTENEAMDAHIKEKLHGTGLTFDFD